MRHEICHAARLDLPLLAFGLGFAGTFGGILGNLVAVRDGDRKVFINHSSLLVGPSGSGKSPVLDVFLNALGAIEAQLQREQSDLKRLAMGRWKAANPGKKGLMVEQEEWESLLNPGEKERLSFQHFSVSDATFAAALQVMSGANAGNMFFFNAEIDPFLSDYLKERGKESSNRQKLLIELYDGQANYSVLRKTKESKIPPIHNACVSVLGGMQTHLLHGFTRANGADYRKDGSFSRMQAICFLRSRNFKNPESLPGQISILEGMQGWQTALKALMEKAVLMRITRERAGATDAWACHLGPEARDVLASFQDSRRKLSAVQKNDQMQAWLLKSDGFALKLAGLFCFLRHASGPDHARDLWEDRAAAHGVTAEEMEWACGWSEMYRLEAEEMFDAGRYLLGKSTSVQELADLLVEGIERTVLKTRAFQARDIIHRGFTFLPRKTYGGVDYDSLDQAFFQLVERGDLEMEGLRSNRSAREVVNWYAVPVSRGGYGLESCLASALGEEEYRKKKLDLQIQSELELITRAGEGAPPSGNNRGNGERPGTSSPEPRKPSGGIGEPEKKSPPFSAGASRVDVDEIRLLNPLEAVVERETGVRGKICGGGELQFNCLFCGEQKGKLAVNRLKQTFHCWVCGAAGGDGIDFLMKARGLEFLEACRELGAGVDVSPEEKERRRKAQEAVALKAHEQLEAEGKRKEERLEAIRASLARGEGAYVDDYLTARMGGQAMTVKALRLLSEGKGYARAPAMVGRFRRYGTFRGEACGYHVTHLAASLVAKAETQPVRMMLGGRDGVMGASIRLAAGHREDKGPSETVIVGEGIETCLGWWCLHGSSVALEGGWSLHAAGSAGMLAGVEIWPEVKTVVVLCDADEAGLKAAGELAARMEASGLRVRLEKPSEGFNDFCDEQVSVATTKKALGL